MVIFNPISVSEKYTWMRIYLNNKSRIALERVVLVKFALQIESVWK